MKLLSPVSSEEVNPSEQGGVHISLGKMLSKSNQSLLASLTNHAVSVGQGLLHTGFPVPKPSSGTVGAPQHGTGQGHPE